MGKKPTVIYPDVQHLPLCYRCEHRAHWHETGHGPRHECHYADRAVWSCYCYRPVFPLVLVPNEGDDRDIGAPWMMSARAHAIAIADDLEPVLVEHRGGVTMTLRKAT